MWVGGADCIGPCIDIAQLGIIELGIFDSKRNTVYLWRPAYNRPARSSTPCRSHPNGASLEGRGAWFAALRNSFRILRSMLCAVALARLLDSECACPQTSVRRMDNWADGWVHGVLVALGIRSLNHYHGQWCGRSWATSYGGCFETVDVCHWSKNECVHVFGVWLFASVFSNFSLEMWSELSVLDGFLCGVFWFDNVLVLILDNCIR